MKITDAEVPSERGVWHEVHGQRLRRHTKASALIQNILVEVMPREWCLGESDKYAFRIEDALRRAKLLK